MVLSGMGNPSIQGHQGVWCHCGAIASPCPYVCRTSQFAASPSQQPPLVPSVSGCFVSNYCHLTVTCTNLTVQHKLPTDPPQAFSRQGPETRMDKDLTPLGCSDRCPSHMSPAGFSPPRITSHCSAQSPNKTVRGPIGCFLPFSICPGLTFLCSQPLCKKRGQATY